MGKIGQTADPDLHDSLSTFLVLLSEQLRMLNK
jgi:hypothetical protein